MKSYLAILLFVCSIGFSFAQTNKIPANTKTLFQGKWIKETKYYTNTLEIKFEKDKDYATFIDIGTGEAPPLILKAYLQGDKLIIPAKPHTNDYAEMTIKNNSLVFFTTSIVEKTNNTNYRTLIFKRVK